jgi:hypothetical protein
MQMAGVRRGPGGATDSLAGQEHSHHGRTNAGLRAGRRRITVTGGKSRPGDATSIGAVMTTTCDTSKVQSHAGNRSAPGTREKPRAGRGVAPWRDHRRRPPGPAARSWPGNGMLLSRFRSRQRHAGARFADRALPAEGTISYRHVHTSAARQVNGARACPEVTAKGLRLAGRVAFDWDGTEYICEKTMCLSGETARVSFEMPISRGGTHVQMNRVGPHLFNVSEGNSPKKQRWSPARCPSAKTAMHLLCQLRLSRISPIAKVVSGHHRFLAVCVKGNNVYSPEIQIT